MVIQVLVEPVLDPLGRTGATEATGLFAVDEQHQRRETTQAEVTGELHVVAIVDFDLCQPQSAAHVLHDPGQVRGDRMAGRAPVGPEVDQDRHVMRCLDDAGLEVGEIADEHIGGIHRYRSLAVVLTAAKGAVSIPFFLGLVFFCAYLTDLCTGFVILSSRQ